MKVTICKPSGARITVEGTSEEVAIVLESLNPTTLPFYYVDPVVERYGGTMSQPPVYNKWVITC